MLRSQTGSERRGRLKLHAKLGLCVELGSTNYARTCQIWFQHSVQLVPFSHPHYCLRFLPSPVLDLNDLVGTEVVTAISARRSISMPGRLNGKEAAGAHPESEPITSENEALQKPKNLDQVYLSIKSYGLYQVSKHYPVESWLGLTHT